MIMLIDNNLIAYEFYKNQYVPNNIYYSGEKQETKLINKYSDNAKEATILALEDNIINKEGYGLKKGFYKIIPDKYLDFFLLYQSGELKAKIPIVQTKIYESLDAQKEQKVEKMSYKKYQKQTEKEYRKYLKGENPNEIEWSEAHIEYIKEQDSYVIIYNTNLLELMGVIKF